MCHLSAHATSSTCVCHVSFAATLILHSVNLKEKKSLQVFPGLQLMHLGPPWRDHHQPLRPLDFCGSGLTSIFHLIFLFFLKLTDCLAILKAPLGSSGLSCVAMASRPPIDPAMINPPKTQLFFENTDQTCCLSRTGSGPCRQTHAAGWNVLLLEKLWSISLLCHIRNDYSSKWLVYHVSCNEGAC